MPVPDARLHFPATLRNRQPILEVLARFLPTRGLVLEVGSGSGEHAMFFAAHLPKLVWRPSDPEPDHRASIAAHAAEAGLDNLLPPLDLDVTSATWPLEQADAVLSINLLHIAPWECCEGLMVAPTQIRPSCCEVCIAVAVASFSTRFRSSTEQVISSYSSFLLISEC